MMDELEERKKFLSSLKTENFNDLIFQVQSKWFSNIDVKKLLIESSVEHPTDLSRS
jgi:outer membrane protein W